MIRKLRHRLFRFRREEKGQMLVEFALVIPLIFTMFMTSVEMGIYQVRQMFLDRGMDMTVRLVRINTGANYTHQQLKTMICTFSGFLNNCDEQLKLQMKPVDIRSFAGFVGTADCTDAADSTVADAGVLLYGTSHQTMILRACYKFDPVFDSSGLGYEFASNGDGAGMAKMVSLSAFVQEP